MKCDNPECFACTQNSLKPMFFNTLTEACHELITKHKAGPSVIGVCFLEYATSIAQMEGMSFDDFTSAARIAWENPAVKIIPMKPRGPEDIGARVMDNLVHVPRKEGMDN